MSKILTITINPAIDKSAKVEQILPEIKLKCSSPCYEPGGGGINVSRAIKKLGGNSMALFQCGGPSGKLMESLLSGEEIEYKTVNTSEWTRENLIVTETSTNRQFRLGMPGPLLSEDEWQEFLSILKEIHPAPEIIVASGSLPSGVPDDFYGKIATLAHGIGAKCFLDTSGKALSAAVAGEKVFLLKPNLKELCELTGTTEITGVGHEKLAMQLVEDGQAEVVVVSLGSKGAIMTTAQGVEKIIPPTIVVKSAVGAGDSMVAGLTLAYARGDNFREMLMYGVACGTAAAMSEGTELCSRENVEKVLLWIKEMNS